MAPSATRSKNAARVAFFSAEVCVQDVIQVKTEHRYQWTVTIGGRRRVVKFLLTEAQIRRDYPNGHPEPVLETLQVELVPETTEEFLEAFKRTPRKLERAGTDRRAT